MVEPSLRGLPVLFNVAARTIFSEGFLVFVIFLMATYAVLGRFLEQGAGVALLALHLGVLAQ